MYLKKSSIHSISQTYSLTPTLLLLIMMFGPEAECWPQPLHRESLWIDFSCSELLRYLLKLLSDLGTTVGTKWYVSLYKKISQVFRRAWKDCCQLQNYFTGITGAESQQIIYCRARMCPPWTPLIILQIFAPLPHCLLQTEPDPISESDTAVTHCSFLHYHFTIKIHDTALFLRTDVANSFMSTFLH